MIILASVIIPTYNRGSQIAATLDSVLAQTLPAEQTEILVIDDGSTDDTVEFIRRTYGGNRAIRLITQQNQGVAVARNRGLAEAQGEFIAFLDHDDIWLPDKLRLQLAAFEAQPHVGVVYCLWEEVDEQGVPLPSARQMSNASWWKPHQGKVLQYLIPFNFIISMSVPMIRTEVLRDIGGFDPATVPCDDWDVWLRLARRCEFKYVPHKLVIYRCHEKQQSKDSARMSRAMAVTVEKQWRYFWANPRKLWFIASCRSFSQTATTYTKAKERLFAGDFRAAKRVLVRELLRHQPLAVLSPQWLYFLKRLIIKDRTPY